MSKSADDIELNSNCGACDTAIKGAPARCDPCFWLVGVTFPEWIAEDTARATAKGKQVTLKTNIGECL